MGNRNTMASMGIPWPTVITHSWHKGWRCCVDLHPCSMAQTPWGEWSISSPVGWNRMGCVLTSRLQPAAMVLYKPKPAVRYVRVNGRLPQPCNMPVPIITDHGWDSSRQVPLPKWLIRYPPTGRCRQVWTSCIILPRSLEPSQPPSLRPTNGLREASFLSVLRTIMLIPAEG